MADSRIKTQDKTELAKFLISKMSSKKRCRCGILIAPTLLWVAWIGFVIFKYGFSTEFLLTSLFVFFFVNITFHFVAVLLLPYTRNKTVMSLKGIGSPAVEPLIPILLDENWRARENAAWILGEIGDVRAINPLMMAFLKDENAKVKESAIDALKKMGTPAIEAITTATNDKYLEDNERELAKQALEQVTPLDEAFRKTLVRELNKWGITLTLYGLISLVLFEFLFLKPIYLANPYNVFNFFLIYLKLPIVILPIINAILCFGVRKRSTFATTGIICLTGGCFLLLCGLLFFVKTSVLLLLAIGYVYLGARGIKKDSFLYKVA